MKKVKRIREFRGNKETDEKNTPEKERDRWRLKAEVSLGCSVRKTKKEFASFSVKSVFYVFRRNKIG